MTENGALRTVQDPAWQLVAEFSGSGEPGRELQLAQQVTGAVQELGLQPAQVERIQEIVFPALRKATQRRKQDWPDSSIRIRIWISGAPPEERSRFSLNGEHSGQRDHRGWGFFLIQKHRDGPQASAAGSHQVIELFLYQERAVSKKHMIVKGLTHSKKPRSGEPRSIRSRVCLTLKDRRPA